MRRWLVFGFVMACGGSGGGGCGKKSDAILFEAKNNYSFTGEFTIQETEVAVDENFCIDWSAITVDVRGREFDPNDVDQLALLRFDLTQAEVEEQIDTNQLKQDDAAYQYLLDAGGVSTACSQDFDIIGNAFDPALLTDDGSVTWVLSLIDLDLGTNDVMMTVFVVPTDGSDNDQVVLQDGSASLTYEVDIDGKPGIVATTEVGDTLILDWSGITKDVNGQPFDPLLGDELLVAHYADYQDASEVEAVFLRLDTEATDIYKLDVFGEVDADLLTAEDVDGKSFPGFTKDGAWLVGVSCTTCTSPVPMLLGWVDVQE